MVTEIKKNIMKTSLLVALFFVCFILCSCNETVKKNPVDKGLINTSQVNMFNDIAMENAIVTQRTLYPYHFINGSEKLNELGNRDVSILIGHLKEYPGQLNLRQGETPISIYQARVAYVSQQLQDAGIDMEKVSIVDDMAGGSGMSTDDVVEIHKADQKVRTERRGKAPAFFQQER